MDPDDTQPGENHGPSEHKALPLEHAAGTTEEFLFVGLGDWGAKGVKIEQRRSRETPIGVGWI